MITTPISVCFLTTPNAKKHGDTQKPYRPQTFLTPKLTTALYPKAGGGSNTDKLRLTTPHMHPNPSISSFETLPEHGLEEGVKEALNIHGSLPPSNCTDHRFLSFSQRQEYVPPVSVRSYHWSLHFTHEAIDPTSFDLTDHLSYRLSVQYMWRLKPRSQNSVHLLPLHTSISTNKTNHPIKNTRPRKLLVAKQTLWINITYQMKLKRRYPSFRIQLWIQKAREKESW